MRRVPAYLPTIFILRGPDLNVSPFYILPHRASFIKPARRFDVSFKATFSNCHAAGENFFVRPGFLKKAVKEFGVASRRKQSHRSFVEQDVLSNLEGEN